MIGIALLAPDRCSPPNSLSLSLSLSLSGPRFRERPDRGRGGQLRWVFDQPGDRSLDDWQEEVRGVATSWVIVPLNKATEGKISSARLSRASVGLGRG
jgi:hypothetical protein